MSPELYAAMAYIIKELPKYVSERKLQLLLYYASVQHLHTYGRMMFPDKFYAYDFGPGVKNLRRFRLYGGKQMLQPVYGYHK